MKKLLLPVCMCIGFSAMAQNTLLKSPTTGAITSTNIVDICIASNGTDVVLLAADKANVYAIDIADNKAGDKAANLITTVPNFVTGKLDPVAGKAVTILDMEVNPISNAVYILANGGTDKFLFKVTNAGATVTLLDLSNITHSKIAWASTANYTVNDMAFGNGTLYISAGSTTLDGQVGWLAAPFANNSSLTQRSTTLFKSNWGNQYYTIAPLDNMTIGQVDGKYRLMGVTVCAPGYSVDVTKLTGTGVLTVTEDFNIHFGFSKKDVFQHHDKKDWLFDLHDNNIYRIGKKYLDGSQVTANNHDANAVQLRSNSGTVNAALPAEDIKLMSTTAIDMMARWDDYRILILETKTGGAKLKLSKMSIENPPPLGVSAIASKVEVSVYPNPASNTVTITLPSNTKNAIANIVSIDGSVVLSQQISGSNATINISNLAAGIYTVNVSFANGSIVSNKLTVE